MTMTSFEQEVIERLTRFETRQETQTALLAEIRTKGCDQGHADRAKLETHDSEIKRLWRYSRAQQVPVQRTKAWAAFGTGLGATAAWLGAYIWDRMFKGNP